MRKVQGIVLSFACAVACSLGISSVAYADVEDFESLQDQSLSVQASVDNTSESLDEVSSEDPVSVAVTDPTLDLPLDDSHAQQDAVDPVNEPSSSVGVPEDPEVPSAPSQPIEPEQPSAPSQPTEPEQPSAPSRPMEPDAPTTTPDPSVPQTPEFTQQFAKVDGRWHYFDKSGKGTGAVNITPGWVKREDVWYWFKNANAYAENEWVSVNGAWYYLGEKGHMLSGNRVIDGRRYYLYADGSMVKGVLWQKIGNTWYYINYGGALTTNTWRYINHKWYYFDEFGRMKTGWIQLGGKWYYLNSSGAMSTGWQKVGSCWYFMRSNGIMHEGWGLIGGKWYYLQPSSGHMRTNWIKLDNKWYLLSQSGDMLTGWQKNDNKWYLLANNGIMQTGWHKVNGNWYFMNQGGSMKANTWYYDEYYKRWYYFEGSGRMNTAADTELHDMIEAIINKRTGRGSDALKRAFDYVVSYPYRSGSLYPTGDWGARYAKEMYRNGSGNCYRYAGLFCWIARGLGYKANVVSGWVPGARVAQAPHGWVEVYVNGSTCICDPDLAHEMPGHAWYMVTFANAPTYYHGW